MKYTNEPLEIKIPVPNGNYEICVTIKAHEDTIFSILSQSRRFVVLDEKIEKGCEKDFTFNANVCDTNMHGCDYYKVENAEIYILCDGAVTATATVSPVDIPTIYIAGDSTVTDQRAEYPYDPSSTYCGWGQMFPLFLNTGIAVSNHAQSGSCTAEFIESNWNAFKDKIKKGDVLIVEFGHNDQKVAALDAFGGYAENLRYFVNYAREKGAYPVLCSPINRIIFEQNGKLRNLLGDYRNAVKGVAEEMKVPFIDLWTRTTEYFETAGPVKSWQFFWGNGVDRDYTHPNDIGGNMVARFVAQEIVKNNVEPVAGFIRTDKIEVEQVYAAPEDKIDSSRENEHLKTIGLVNVPADIADLDKDITDNHA